jgi:HK97 family phage portal protein
VTVHNRMLTSFRSWLRRRASAWFKLSQVPSEFFGPDTPGAVRTPHLALTISAFWCGVKLYCDQLGSLPLVTYRGREGGGQDEARELEAFEVLNKRPNPAMSRSVFGAEVARAIICDGEFFAQVRKTEGGELVGLYPIPRSSVVDVGIDDEWRKVYLVQPADGGPQEVYRDEEMVHLFWWSLDGIRGTALLEYAGESLGLHRQVLESATAFYTNAVRPSGYLKYPGKLNKEAIEVIKDWFKKEYSGTSNTGKLPVTHDGGEFVRFPSNNADEARIIEALGASVDDVARWLGISPLLLFNLTRGTYSNLAADNAAFYQRTLRPLLDRVELELNWKIFGRGSNTFAEFKTEAILRGDPEQQARVANIGIQNGSVLRSEQRGWLNLPPVPGLDQPLYPSNMEPAGATTDATKPDPAPIDAAA